MAGGINLLRLLDWAVVQPQDDVASVAIVLKSGAGHGHGLVRVLGEDGQRAGSIEADAFDGAGVDVGLVDHMVHTVADAGPDVRGGLFLGAGLGSVEAGMGGRACLT